MLNIMQGQLDDYDAVSLNLNKQLTAGPVSPLDSYGEMMAVIEVPEQVGQVLGFVRQIQDITTQAVTNYLFFLAPELGLTSNASIATILQTLANQMIATGQTIPRNSGYGAFFNNQYNFQSFPSSDSPTIPAGWITSDLV